MIKSALSPILASSFLIIAASLTLNCNGTPRAETPQIPSIPSQPAPETPPNPPGVAKNCEFEPVKYKLKDGRNISLPAFGSIIQESHYATTKDAWPKTVTDGIKDHLDRSCEYMKHNYKITHSECDQMYKVYWARQWTPSEGGQIGQNARGKKMDILPEMFQGNMYFQSKSKGPALGEKWLLYNPITRKAVVLAMGYEIGPSNPKRLGGATIEAFHFLQAKNEASLLIGKLKDQSVSYGPITCSSDL